LFAILESSSRAAIKAMALVIKFVGYASAPF